MKNFKSIGIAALFLFALNINAQNKDKNYTEKVRTHASTFHKNFSTGDFDKNAALVNEKIYVNSNTAIVVGRDNFVTRIKRYHTPFPKLQLKDKIVLVDGNNAALLYVLQGTQDGSYGSIPASGNKVNVYAAEFFTMDDDALMKELLTITQLDRLVQQIKGLDKVNAYENVSVLPLSNSNFKKKKIRKDHIEEYVQNFNTRNWEALENLFSNTVKVDWNGKKGRGFKAVKEGLNLYTSNLPNLTFHLERNVVEGDRGSMAYTMDGTFTHPTEKKSDGKALTKAVQAKEGVHIQFDEEGKIIEIIVVSNADDILKQMQ